MIYFAGKAAKVLTLSLLTALLLTVSAFAAEEGLAQAAGITTGAALRMRTEPSTESSVVTQLNKDVIVAVEGRAVSDTGDLARITRSRGVGDLVDITVRRDGKLLDLTIPLVKAEG